MNNSSTRTVGIVTYHFVDNYGAVLQAYALVKCLSELDNIDVCVINYHPDHVADGGKLRLPFSKKNIRANLIIIYQKLIKLYARSFYKTGINKKFLLFRQQNLNVSNRVYKTIEELRNNPPLNDVYITGSDQVWNPSEQYGLDEAYFLDFGPPSTKRIAYAVSFGRDKLPAEYKHILAKFIPKLDAISIRERSGIDIVSDISNANTLWLPDPTLLIKDYTKITELPNETDQFMFSYVLRSGKQVKEVQEYIAGKLNLNILTPHNPMKRWKNIGRVIYPSPEQWLGYIKKSNFVVTNSYHGTIFSILLNKPFVVIGLSGTKTPLNARVKSLLDRLGLSERLLTDFNLRQLDDLIEKEIDWGNVMQNIESWRAQAIRFLQHEIIGKE